MIHCFRLKDLRLNHVDQFADPWIANGVFTTPASSCPKCGHSKETPERLGELVIEWVIDKYAPGSDVIADFYILGGDSPVMVSDRFRAFLINSRYGKFKFAPVKMVQDPKLKKPRRITSRTKKRVWLPYLGPPLHEVVVTGKAKIDLELNRVEISEHLVCSHCNRYTQLRLQPSAKAPWIVRQSDWDGSDFFCLRYPSQKGENENNPYLVTEQLRNSLIAENFTNLGFEPFGYIQ